MPRHSSALLIVAALTCASSVSQAQVIEPCESLRFRPSGDRAHVDIVEGKVGKAVRFRFDPEARGVFCTSAIKGASVWDQADGLSFWVKGDAPDTNAFAGIEFIYDEDYAVRYDYVFPIKGNHWTKVNVAWADLVPVLPGPRCLPLGNGPNQNRPSKLSGLWVGKWWYWGNYPALAFCLDEISLESKLSKPVAAPLSNRPLARVAEKLKSGQPITIVTMGDSLTDKRHWANRQVAWVDLLKSALEKRSGASVRIVNPAIGGTQLRQNVILIPTWLDQTPEPDLVTIFFGGNDFDAGMRGPEFERACLHAIERARELTRGKADVLLMTTNPSAAHWGATAELAEACRTAARTANAGLADTEAAFRRIPEADRTRYFVDDRVHLSRAGHELVAKTVLDAILSQK